MPRLLDLFCGAGGAGMGYTMAGFEVVGVDIEAQPGYVCGEFVRADALEVLQKPFEPESFDVIHASPPCQRYMTGGTHRKDHPDLIGEVRALLQETKKPWVLENVPGAPMRRDLLLCGSMFDLRIRRHRIFEFDKPRPRAQPECHHRGKITGVYGNPHGERGAWPSMLPSTLAVWRREMGIDWMTTKELSQAIPPAYTEFIGKELIARLGAGASRGTVGRTP